jgi:hypothetical protein
MNNNIICQYLCPTALTLPAVTVAVAVVSPQTKVLAAKQFWGPPLKVLYLHTALTARNETVKWGPHQILFTACINMLITVIGGSDCVCELIMIFSLC